MKVLWTLMMLGAAGATSAQETIPPDAALDLLRGHVIDYDDATRERFREDDTVSQQYPDGSCIEGVVFAQEGALCFVYDGTPERQHCWWVEQDTTGLWVQSVSGDGRFEITDIGKQPLSCEQDDLIG
ncbi:hypothetical protein [Pontivivens insulae]|uniref:DUF995 domain-containing protein n=1 Tax=Pontivivens insulae TaxID=1639689 RepID=A0A2R8AFQ0_9RHOB|nr:hypothetical protein [Pontivivens insulae]RED12317.1 hypothetical protein DFR53_3036 [Pontivivens insulae]SPF31073.1 hypothetical protein POI8812_03424 [Pontivivens insulae]